MAPGLKFLLFSLTVWRGNSRKDNFLSMMLGPTSPLPPALGWSAVLWEVELWETGGGGQGGAQEGVRLCQW